MKLTYTDGCTHTSLTVDGKEFNLDLTGEERRNVAKEILKVAKNVFEPVYEAFLDCFLYMEVGPIESKQEYWDKYYRRYDEKTEKFSKLPIECQRRYTLYLIDKIIDDWICQEVFIKYLTLEGKGGYEYTCECCGDAVYHYEIKI